MAIQFPDEQTQTNQKNVDTLIASQGGSTVDMGMLTSRLDVNGNQRILINDGTNDRILIGYQQGGF